MPRVDIILVDRLWSAYDWPEDFFSMEKISATHLDQFVMQTRWSATKSRTDAWNYGRVRFFYDQLKRGIALDPITIDNVTHMGTIYPYPILVDGHHRLAAAYLAHSKTIEALYQGRIDLLNFLTGKRKTCPGGLPAVFNRRSYTRRPLPAPLASLPPLQM
jgi:hypothetical protein